MTEAAAVREFDRAWKALSGMWYRMDTGRLTGRNARSTDATVTGNWKRLNEAYYAMSEADAEKRAAKWGYAERRVKVGRDAAESHKVWAKGMGFW